MKSVQERRKKKLENWRCIQEIYNRLAEIGGILKRIYGTA
jgi:hypothetical protein